MEGKAWGYTGLRLEGNVCYSRWEPGSAAPGVLLAQLFKSITCYGRTFHMKGTLAVMADEGLFWF